MSALSESTTVTQPEVELPAITRERPHADQFMRKLLRVNDIGSSQKSEKTAHRNLQLAMVISGVRCIITYLFIPIAVPIIGLSGIVSAPIGIALSAIAVITGISSLRQFWRSDHQFRWMYSAFIGIIFIILAIAFVADITQLVRAISLRTISNTATQMLRAVQRLRPPMTFQRKYRREPGSLSLASPSLLYCLEPALQSSCSTRRIAAKANYSRLSRSTSNI